ncbi:MAG: peptidylprolyl isomerase [Oscillospiraceae bacterium]|nr:peptidylprolyl isomerase [Oscillospiraceae bacterium]
MSSKEKKAAAAAEEAQKNKKFYRNCIIFIVCLAIVVAAAAFINSDYTFTKTTAIEIGDTKYSPAEFSYYYRSAVSQTYSDLYNSYGEMAGYFLNTGTSLEDQIAMYGDGTQSWAQYFYDQAILAITNVTVLYDAALENGYTLDDEAMASVDADIAFYEQTALANGYPDVESFLATNFGDGFDSKLLREIAEKQYLASAYSADVEASFEYTADEKEAYYEENKDTFDFFKYHMYFVGTSSAAFENMSDEEKVAAAHDAAVKIADAASGAQFVKNVQDFVPDESKASYKDETATMGVTQGGNLGSIYAEWLIDSARVEGDTTVIDSDGGSYAVMFVSRNDNHYNLVNVRHILIGAEADENGEFTEEALAEAKAEAERIYAEWQENPTEENFAALATEYSEDSGSAANGGLYEGVYMDYMVEEFNDFLFNDGNKPGDSGIVYGTNGSYAGYHIMYYSADGEVFSDAMADTSLRADDYNAVISEKAENYEVKIGNGMKHVELA